MNERTTVQAAGTTSGPVVRVRAGTSVPVVQQTSWLQARAPGLNARQQQLWRERLWACLSLLVLVASWDLSVRLDDQVAAAVLEVTSPGA